MFVEGADLQLAVAAAGLETTTGEREREEVDEERLSLGWCWGCTLAELAGWSGEGLIGTVAATSSLECFACRWNWAHLISDTAAQLMAS